MSAIRDPLADHLITPQNAAMALIDYQRAARQLDVLRMRAAARLGSAETVADVVKIVLTERLHEE